MVFIFCDGASKGNPGPASIGIVAKRSLDTNEELFTISKALGKKTNNHAEWVSLLTALEHALDLHIKEVTVFMDSELVVKQVKGVYKVKHPDLIPFKVKSQELISQFSSFQISHIYREKNKRADELANLALNQSVM